MENALLFGRRKASFDFIEASKIRMKFLERGRNNTNGSISSFIGITLVEYFDELDNKIVIQESMMAASSEYSSAYRAGLAAYAPQNTYWCSTSANDGNINGTCWLDTNFGSTKKISKMKIWGSPVYTCNHIQVEDQVGNILYKKQILTVPTYPSEYYPGGTPSPVLTIIFPVET